MITDLTFNFNDSSNILMGLIWASILLNTNLTLVNLGYLILFIHNSISSDLISKSFIQKAINYSIKKSKNLRNGC